MRKNKVLLIWPPFLNSNHVALTIPSLVGFLKGKGLDDVEVFDMNLAYWKTLGPYWSFYRLLRRGQGILRKRGQASSAAEKFLTERMARVLETMETKGMRFLPWSLEGMLDSFKQDSWFSERKKVRGLMRPLLGRQDLSFIGLSINFPDQLFFGLMIAHEIKERHGDSVRVVAGGAQITKNIRQLTENRDVHRLIDFFIVGDGEEPLHRLLAATPDAQALSQVPNLYYKDGGGEGAYVFSGKRFVLTPDDFVVPDFQGFDLAVYRDMLPVLGAAGCPWGQCSFCSYAGAQDRRFIAGSAPRTSRIIRALQEKYGISTFGFVDNAMTWACMKTLAEQFLQDGLRIEWNTNINLDRKFADPDLCRLLRESGLTWVGFGLESVCRRVLGLMNKYHRDLAAAEIKRILTVMREAGIEIGVYIFFGFPTETRAEALETLDFVLDNIDLFDFVGMTPFFLEDMTMIFEEPAKYGITEIYAQHKAKLVNKRLTYGFKTREGMDREEVRVFCGEALGLLRLAFKKKARRGVR